MIRHLGSTRGVSAINAGVPAASIVANMKYILKLQANRQPQAMVVNFSPVGFYQFQNFPGPQIPGLKIQDLLDDRLDSYLAEWLWTRGRPEELADHFGAYWRTRKIWRAVTWVSRSTFADGFMNATLAYSDGSPMDAGAYQLLYFGEFVAGVRENPAAARLRRDEISGVIRAARAAGWTVVLVRFPIGARMRDLEAELPPDLRPDALALAVGVPFLDYTEDPRTAGLATLDESHLTPDSAREMARILAHDLFPLLR